MVQNVPYFKDKGDSNSSAGWKVRFDIFEVNLPEILTVVKYESVDDLRENSKSLRIILYPWLSYLTVTYKYDAFDKTIAKEIDLLRFDWFDSCG